MSTYKYSKLNHKSRPIFIFSVCGRSSSTALQRVLNSSNEVWIWGEQHFIVDELMEIIRKLDYFMLDRCVKLHSINIENSFEIGKHFFPYANAVGNIKKFKEKLIYSLIEHFRPIQRDIRRFGFKEIRLKSINTLKILSSVFTDCFFIFLFRNPIDQWPSVNKYKMWDYSYKLNDFLCEYQRISDIMLEYSISANRCLFFENTSIQNIDKMNKLISCLELHSVDKAVADIFINPLSEAKTIEYDFEIVQHSAFQNYLLLKSNELRIN